MAKYMLALKESRYPDYLGFGSHVVGSEGRFVIVEARDEHAEWQLGRLVSGLVGVPMLFDTSEEARAEARARTW